MDRHAAKVDFDQQLVKMVRKRLSEGEAVVVTVNGRSMLPLLHPNDHIQIAPVQPSQLARGDIITLAVGGALLTHRFWGHLENRQQLLTRGDTQSRFDPPYNHNQLVGRVTKRHRGHLQFQQGTGRWLNGYLKSVFALSYKLEQLLKKDSTQSYTTTAHRIFARLLRTGTASVARIGVKVVELWLT